MVRPPGPGRGPGPARGARGRRAGPCRPASGPAFQVSRRRRAGGGGRAGATAPARRAALAPAPEGVSGVAAGCLTEMPIGPGRRFSEIKGSLEGCGRGRQMIGIH